MGYRNIVISSPCKLSTRNNNLIISTHEEYQIPLEDIDTIVLESQQIQITSMLMGRLAECQICTYVCDSKHMPCAVLLGYNSHSRKYKMLKAQLSLKKPTEKGIWKTIVTQKIKNQAKVLNILEIYGDDYLEQLAKEVRSGDSKNAEATAARKYFKLLYGKGFTRSKECVINSALNYGYAIIRGLISRTLAAYGFETALGVFHENELNSFNLSDDLLEIYRPLVDLYVKENIYEFIEDGLTPENKRNICNIINYNMEIEGEVHSLSYSIEKLVQSLRYIYLVDDKGKLALANIVNLEIHEYE
ncbi:MAG: type II CRISPR-associated endonuclease Cas1 [Filifactoraceae bacterium]